MGLGGGPPPERQTRVGPAPRAHVVEMSDTTNLIHRLRAAADMYVTGDLAHRLLLEAADALAAYLHQSNVEIDAAAHCAPEPQ